MPKDIINLQYLINWVMHMSDAIFKIQHPNPFEIMTTYCHLHDGGRKEQNVARDRSLFPCCHHLGRRRTRSPQNPQWHPKFMNTSSICLACNSDRAESTSEQGGLLQAISVHEKVMRLAQIFSHRYTLRRISLAGSGSDKHDVHFADSSTAKIA